MKCSSNVSMSLWGGRSLNGTPKWVMSTLVLAIEKNKKLLQNKPLSILLGTGVAAGHS